MQSISPQFRLDWVDLYKSLRGWLVVFVGTFGTIFLGQLQMTFSSGTFPTDLSGIFLAIKIATVATIVELGRRYMTDHTASTGSLA